MFLLLVFGIGITQFIQKYIFYYAGENLTYDIRNLLYKGIIYKEISWFDDKNRAPGILSNTLSEDIASLNGMTTEHLAILIEAYGGLVVGTIISLLYTWKLGLISLLLVPFVILGGIMMAKLGYKKRYAKAAEDDPY